MSPYDTVSILADMSLICLKGVELQFYWSKIERKIFTKSIAIAYVRKWNFKLCLQQHTDNIAIGLRRHIPHFGLDLDSIAHNIYQQRIRE